MRSLLCACLAFSLVVVSAHGALASPKNTYTVTLSALPATYNGVCPVTIKFTGNISGKPFSSISYSFAHTLGKTTTTTLPVSATLSKTGILPPVFNSLSIDAAHAGAQANELDVTPGTSKASVAFSVTCTPPPKLGSGSNLTIGSAVGSNSALAPPTPKPLAPPMQLGINPLASPHLASTTDPGVCAAHFGPDIGFVALLCGAAIKAGLMLVWDWSPTPNCPTCPQSVDGYNIYRTDGGRRQKLWNQSPQDAKGWGPGVPSDGWAGKCYQASAVAGTQESYYSNAVCVASNAQIGTQTATFTPQVARTAQHLTIHKSGVCNTTNTTLSFRNGTPIEIGYDYDNFTAFCDQHKSENWRAGVLFDLSSLAGKKVFKATLHLGQAHTDYAGAPNAAGVSYAPEGSGFSLHSSSWSCGNVIGTGTNAWWSSPTWFSMSDFSNWSGGSTPLDINVTTKVGSWLQGSPNYGFVMRSSIEGDLNDFNNLWLCDTQVYQPSLTVEYFP